MTPHLVLEIPARMSIASVILIFLASGKRFSCLCRDFIAFHILQVALFTFVALEAQGRVGKRWHFDLGLSYQYSGHKRGAACRLLIFIFVTHGCCFPAANGSEGTTGYDFLALSSSSIEVHI
jgi:hypothetical protein